MHSEFTSSTSEDLQRKYNEQQIFRNTEEIICEKIWPNKLTEKLYGKEGVFRIEKAAKKLKLLNLAKKPPLAGFTYLGQFISHDIVYKHSIEKNCKPSLCLDSIYGLPLNTYLFEGSKFKLFEFCSNDSPHPQKISFDFERNESNWEPLIANKHNDTNLFVSQVQLVFMRLHNALVDVIREKKLCDDEISLFELAKKLTIWCYQYIVVYQYLPAVIYDVQLVEDLAEGKQDFFLFNRNHPNGAELMVEFTHGAMKFAHSQIKNSYQIKKGNYPSEDFFSPDINRYSLTNNTKYRDKFFDWQLFFDITGHDGGQYQYYLQFSDLIDPFYATVLFMPGPITRGQKESVPVLDIYSSQFMLSYHTIAKALSKHTNPEAEEIDVIVQSKIMELIGSSLDEYSLYFPNCLPLSLYVLLEANFIGNQVRLGPLGSRIISEQFLWTLLSDSNSFLYNAKEFATFVKKFGIGSSFGDEQQGFQDEINLEAMKFISFQELILFCERNET